MTLSPCKRLRLSPACDSSQVWPLVILGSKKNEAKSQPRLEGRCGAGPLPFSFLSSTYLLSFMRPKQTFVFAHLGFIRESGGRVWADKGQQICQWNAAAYAAQSVKYGPHAFADGAKSALSPKNFQTIQLDGRIVFVMSRQNNLANESGSWKRRGQDCGVGEI